MYNNDLPSDVQQSLGKPSRSMGIALKPQGGVANKNYIKQPFVSSQKITDSNGQANIIVAPSPIRTYLLIQNVGFVTVYLGFGAFPDVNGNNAVQLPPGTQIDFPAGFVPQNEVYACSTGQGLLAVLEGIGRV